MKESDPRISEEDRVASAPDAPAVHVGSSRNETPAASRAPLPPRPQRPPTLRLTATRTMDDGDQRRLELLLDLLIERRAARVIQREESDQP